MPKSESSRLEALEQLLAERRKHEGYLAKLEERRAATPEHVFTRLRTEYLTKLTDLQVRAAAEAEGLADGIEEDRTAVVAIEERLADVHEERLEGELRAEVGEYDPKEWAKKLTVLNATIAQLEKERESKAGAWERTQRLVNEARAGIAGAETPAAPREAPSAPAPAAAPEVRVPESAAAAPPPPVAAPAVPVAAPAAKKPTEIAGAPSFDELAFLNSVVGRVSTPVPIPQPMPVPRSSRPVPVEPEPASSPSVAPRAPTPVRPAVEAVAPPAPPPVAAPVVAPEPVAAAPAPAPAAVAPPAPAAPAPIAEAPSAPPPAPPREDEPPGPLGRPTPRTSQAIKTLKCQECGTFNYPTEWYCERCGGELAAL